MTITEILSTLDNCDEHDAFNFISLGHPYVYLVDCRLNVFRNDSDKWAIVSEVLGYSTRGFGYAVALEIRYFGNCLTNLDVESDKVLNYYSVLPIDWNTFNETIDDVTQSLKPDAKYWLVRGTKVPLSHNKEDYIQAGIDLKEYEPEEISGEEVARLVVQNYRHLFRATNDELYKSIPGNIEKILVVDEWCHKEFYQSKSPFEKSEILNSFDLTNPQISEMVNQESDKLKRWNLEQWENRPGNYETWQQIAKVITSGNTSFYSPTLEPNTHWKNWPEGGSL